MNSPQRRWDPCIYHSGDDANGFIAQHFAEPARNVFLIAGAGFDPRSTAIATQLTAVATNIEALFIRETRPDPAPNLLKRADANQGALAKAVAKHEILPIAIFGPDGAVVGGRNVATALSSKSLEDLTDVVVDVSALSVGTSFPAIRYLIERSAKMKAPYNLHVLVTHDPQLDMTIKSVASDAPGYVHGFRGQSTLDSAAGAARLWLPQLSAGRGSALGRLHAFVAPHDTCPILPFPCSDARRGDKLAEEYRTEFEDSWEVDTRNIVYADEEDPIDLYRTILRLDDLRRPVFEQAGGSMLVLSPLGSKVTALGALLAALERNLPVAYLESIGYELAEDATVTNQTPNLVHIWLEGEVYPQPRPALQS